MKLLSDFSYGFINCFKGFTVLFEKGLWYFLFFPLIIWILLWTASIYGVFSLAEYISEWLTPYLSLDNIGNDIQWLSFIKPKLSGVFGFIIRWTIKIIFWFIGSVFTKYILLIILSPVFSLLSELADEKLTGNKFPFNIIQLLKDVVRGTLINIRNMLLELLIGFALWLITFFFPPLIVITFPLGLFVGWYFIGFSLLDYSCERHKQSVSEGVQFVRQNKGYAIGIGCVYAMFMALPTIAGDLIGIMVGPTIAVIGATLSFLEIKGRMKTS